MLPYNLQSNTQIETVLKYALICVSVAVSIASTYYSYLNSIYFVDPAHNGYFLKNAIDMLEGKLLFRDSFNSYGILSTAIHATGMTIWGWKIPALLWITLPFIYGSAVLIYYIWREVMPDWCAALATLTFLSLNFKIHLPWPNYYGAFFSLLATICFLVWLRNQKARLVTFAGICCGLVFLSRQTMAPPLLLTLLGLLLLCNWRSLNLKAHLLQAACFLSSFAAICIIFWLYLSLTNSFEDWWIQSVTLVPAWYKPFSQIDGGIFVQAIKASELILSNFPWLIIVAGVANIYAISLKSFSWKSLHADQIFTIAGLSSALIIQIYPNGGAWRSAVSLAIGAGWLVYFTWILLLKWNFLNAGHLAAVNNGEVRVIRNTPLVIWQSPLWILSVLVFPLIMLNLWLLDIQLGRLLVVSLFALLLCGLIIKCFPKFSIIIPYAVTSLIFATSVMVPVKHMATEIKSFVNLTTHREKYYTLMSEPEVLAGMWLQTEQATFYKKIYEALLKYRTNNPTASIITTIGDPLPLTFFRGVKNFSPMFTVYPSLTWARESRVASANKAIDNSQKYFDKAKYQHDTANIIGYPTYWNNYDDFIRNSSPIIINAGEPVPGYVKLAEVTYKGTEGASLSQYYFWWTQFGNSPMSTIWIPSRIH